MISEIAIYPNCFCKNEKDENIIFLLMDVLDYGIYIQDFQSFNYLKYILDNHISKLDDSLQSKVKVLISRLKDRKRFIPVSNYSKSIISLEDWFDVAYIHYTNDSLDLFISDSLSYEKHFEKLSDKCCLIYKLHIEEKWRTIKKRDIIMSFTIENYINLTKKILNNSSKIKLIDPYFFPTKRYYQRLLIESLKFIGEREGLSSLPTTIEIHTKFESFEEDKETKNKKFWTELVTSLNKKADISLKIFFWDDNSEKDTFHDRFILSNSFGFSFSNSFKISRDSIQELTVNLLSNESLDIQLDKFTEGDYKFKLKDSLEF